MGPRGSWRRVRTRVQGVRVGVSGFGLRGCRDFRRPAMVGLDHASSWYTKLYSVIYDSGSVPDQSIFPPRGTPDQETAVCESRVCVCGHIRTHGGLSPALSLALSASLWDQKGLT
jgi:hypothetical protein